MGHFGLTQINWRVKHVYYGLHGLTHLWHVSYCVTFGSTRCWGPFFRPTWYYFIGNPCHINILLIFWINLFKTQNKLISHSTTWIGLTWPARFLLQETDSCPHFLFINWDHNSTTSSTSTYGSGLSNESKLMAHITSLTLMASGFFKKSPYLHKMTTKPKVRHLIFSLWSKLISLFGETLGVVVWKVKRYIQ